MQSIVFPSASRVLSRLSQAVIGYHTNYFSALHKFHELRRLGSFLIQVAEHDAADAAHHVEQLETQIRIGLEPALKVAAQRRASRDCSAGIVEYFRRSRGDQDGVLGVMRQNSVEIMSVPSRGPLI